MDKFTGYKDKHGAMLFVGDHITEIFHMGSIKEQYYDGVIIEVDGSFIIDFDDGDDQIVMKEVACSERKRLDGRFSKIPKED